MEIKNHSIRNELADRDCVVHGPRYANMRIVIIVGRGLTNANGVGDNELIAVDGYE